MKEKYMFVIVMICMFILGIAVTELINSFDIKSKVEKVNYGDCQGMNLINTSYCLNNELNSFYKVNYSNTGKDLSLDQLKEWGGTCKNFADFYLNRLIELGAKNKDCGDTNVEKNDSKFYVTECDIMTDNQTSHAIILLSNNESWCMFCNDKLNCGDYS